jgi:LVIVD repeat
MNKIDRPNGALARNVRRLGHLDLPGAGQVTIAGHFAYVGHIPNKQQLGTSIVDIADPANPRLVASVTLDDPARPRPAPVVVMALCAAQVDLALTFDEQPTPRVDERLEPLIMAFFNRHAARLPSDIGSHRQHILTLEFERLRLLVVGAADIDALLEIDRTFPRSVVGGISRRDAPPSHGSRRQGNSERARASERFTLLLVTPPHDLRGVQASTFYHRTLVRTARH